MSHDKPTHHFPKQRISCLLNTKLAVYDGICKKLLYKNPKTIKKQYYCSIFLHFGATYGHGRQV